MTVYITVNGIRGRLTMETLPLFERIYPFMSEMKLSDLQQDSRNANKGSARGQQMIETSLQKYGAGRSIVLSKEGVILCGNHTAEAAATVGLDENVVVVQTTGDQLVAVQRMDLSADDPRARELAYADNRSGQVSLNFSAEMLQEDFHSGELDLTPFFTEAEIEKFSNEDHEDDEEWEQDEVQPDLLPENHLQLKVIAGSHEDKIELAQELEGRGYRVTI